MTISLSDNQVRLLRTRAQGLECRREGSSSVKQVVQKVCGLQAQDLSAAMLAVRVRSIELTSASVESALWQERSVVRTWGQRGTLHLLAAHDLGWLLPLLGPSRIATNRRRYIELGLDEDFSAAAIQAIREALASRGPLTRSEIAQHLSTHDIAAEGQALYHLISRAALDGILCLGPHRGNEPACVLIDGWTDRGQPLTQDDSLATIARRYLSAYGPAGPADLAAWSGLNASKVRRAWNLIAGELTEVSIDGLPAWMLKTQIPWLDELPAHSPSVRLLPAYDTCLLGYASRHLIVTPEYAKRINAGGGAIHPVLLVGGRVQGTWSIKRRKNHLEMSVQPFDSLPPDIYAGVESEVADIGRFLGVNAVLAKTS
ncbi:MAG: winged helix DNA-binding domain-containing protein [Thermacetogeniaceae bacterium]